MEMKNELGHFNIGDSYGGNQDWFPTFMMRVGGCGAETACDSSIYFALNYGIKGIAPENARAMTRDDYTRFAYEMEPYLSPRVTGIDRLDIFIDGYNKYLADRDITGITMRPFSGTETFEAARDAVLKQIDGGCPIPTLILRHRNKRFEDYVWHWFLINGYDDRPDGFMVKAVTYSKYEWLDLKQLWDTGCKRRGGFVLYGIEK